MRYYMWSYRTKHRFFIIFFHSLSLPDDYRCGKSLGPVESLQEHPQQAGKILIGYSRGLVVLWDLSSRHADQLFLGKQVLPLEEKKKCLTTDLISLWPSSDGCACEPALQQLESLVWERSGNLFVSSHNDGGYSVWAVTNGNIYNHQPVSSTIPYGEKPIENAQRWA